MRKIKVAVTQMKSRGEAAENIAAADRLAREAAAAGARIILLPELVETDYFCQKMRERNVPPGAALKENPAVVHFRRVAAELEAVIPVSFFERAGQARYNSLAIIDADGRVLGAYRKSHLPDGPGYSEKFFMNAGDTGFRVWNTRYGRIGCGVCWDQWFPEAARCLALKGAEMLLYPTAIGSEPEDPAADTMFSWRTVMQGHAAANMMPVLASNRVGEEHCEDSAVTFYGSSFIADAMGRIVEQLGRRSEGFACAEFDLDALDRDRRAWGFFRDRRPDLYGAIMTLDGLTPYVK
jgi:N-carbamoylputrescine amidase